MSLLPKPHGSGNFVHTFMTWQVGTEFPIPFETELYNRSPSQMEHVHKMTSNKWPPLYSLSATRHQQKKSPQYRSQLCSSRVVALALNSTETHAKISASGM